MRLTCSGHTARIQSISNNRRGSYDLFASNSEHINPPYRNNSLRRNKNIFFRLFLLKNSRLFINRFNVVRLQYANTHRKLLFSRNTKVTSNTSYQTGTKIKASFISRFALFAITDFIKQEKAMPLPV